MDPITELALFFKERENVIYQGPQTGFVISPPPEIKISLGDKIILEKEHLVIAARVLAGYHCEAEYQSDMGDLSFHLKGSPPANDYTITNLNVPGTITYTDMLKKGDEVILIPSTDNQTFFLVDKAVRL